MLESRTAPSVTASRRDNRVLVGDSTVKAILIRRESFPDPFLPEVLSNQSREGRCPDDECYIVRNPGRVADTTASFGLRR